MGPKTQDKFTEICNGLLEKLNQSSAGDGSGFNPEPLRRESLEAVPNKPTLPNPQNRTILSNKEILPSPRAYASSNNTYAGIPTGKGYAGMVIGETTQNHGINQPMKRKNVDINMYEPRDVYQNRDMPISLNELNSQNMNLEKLKLV